MQNVVKAAILALFTVVSGVSAQEVCLKGKQTGPGHGTWEVIPCQPLPTPTPTPVPTPTPTPKPTPTPTPPVGACNVPLVRVGSAVHHYEHANGVESEVPVRGGKIVLHATYRFGQPGDQRGLPCDGAPNNQACGGAVCEDARGAVWRLVSGGGNLNPQGFFAKMNNISGKVVVEACPPSDVKYPDGRPMPVVGPRCSMTTVFVP
jgi:hypothetical protein